MLGRGAAPGSCAGSHECLLSKSAAPRTFPSPTRASTASAAVSGSCSSRHPAGGERVRPSAEAGRPRRHRGVGGSRGQSVGDRSGRGDRDRGADASARPRRAGHVPVRAARRDQQAVRGRGSARREGVGCRHAAGGGLTRAVLADGAGAHRSGRDGVAASRRSGPRSHHSEGRSKARRPFSPTTAR